MTAIYLHSYDASPFTQKAIKMMAIKGLEWRCVTTPMIAPKPDLEMLTGGYRGTPVLQIGADVYVDNVRIARALEVLQPEPSLFPNGNRGMPIALDHWSDAFFEAGLHLAITDLSKHWDDAFAADRKAVFARLDFDQVKAGRAEAAARLRAHAALVEEQLADGRDFLQGAKPGLADIHAWAVPWFVRPLLADGGTLLAAFTHLPAWEARMAALGHGRRSEAPAAEAHAAAKTAQPAPAGGVDMGDPLGLSAGDLVVIAPVTSNRGESRGRLISLSPIEIVIAVESPAAGHVHVHFPRPAYAVTAA